MIDRGWKAAPTDFMLGFWDVVILCLAPPDTLLYLSLLRSHYKDTVPLFGWGCFLIDLAAFCHYP
jgi:hypothetical protein